MRQTAPCAAWGEDRRAVEPGRRAGRVMSSNAPEPCRRRMHDRCRRRVGAIRAGRCRTSDLVRGYTDPTATRQIRCGYRRRVNAGCAVACSSRRRRRPPTLRRRPLASPHGERSRAAVRRVGCVPRRTHRAGCASEQSERAEVARVKLALTRSRRSMGRSPANLPPPPSNRTRRPRHLTVTQQGPLPAGRTRAPLRGRSRFFSGGGCHRARSRL
jgi:hypothetical protein